jgi:hypothetical protein
VVICDGYGAVLHMATDTELRAMWCALLLLAGMSVAHGQGLRLDPNAVAKAGGSFASFDKVIAVLTYLVLRWHAHEGAARDGRCVLCHVCGSTLSTRRRLQQL